MSNAGGAQRGDGYGSNAACVRLPGARDRRDRIDPNDRANPNDAAPEREWCAGAVVSATAAGGAAATARRTCGRSTGLFALPYLDRLAAEAPVATDAEPRQPSLPEQAVDGRRMNPQVFRQFLDGENLIAGSYLRHALNRLAYRRDFLRRPFLLHSSEPWIRTLRLSLCCGVSGVKTLSANSRTNPHVSARENTRAPRGKSFQTGFKVVQAD
jgi:hypothetical protein